MKLQQNHSESHVLPATIAEVFGSSLVLVLMNSASPRLGKQGVNTFIQASQLTPLFFDTAVRAVSPKQKIERERERERGGGEGKREREREREIL